MSEDNNSSQAGAASATIVGPIWFIGWVFTIGFAKLTFVKGVWAIVLWPYYLGATLAV